MAVELDSVHVVGLALVPVGGPPDAHHGRDLRRIAGPAFEPGPHYEGDGIEVVDHFEAVFLRVVVDPAHVREKIEAEFRILLEEAANLDDEVRLDQEGLHAVGDAPVQHPAAETLLYFLAQSRAAHGYPTTIASSDSFLLSTRDFWIFSWSRRMPCMRASGLGGQPAT